MVDSEIMFWDYGAKEAKEALAAITSPEQATNKAYFDGDHWQGGAAYVGPRPDPTEQDAAKVLGEIERAYVSKNAIREVAQRAALAVVGKELRWAFTPTRPLKKDERPTTEEQALIDEASAAMTAWWDQRGVQRLAIKAAAMLQWAGRATLRSFIPRGFLAVADHGLAVPAGDLAQQLDRIFVMVPAPAMGGVVVNEDTQQRCGVYVYADSKGQEHCELVFLDPQGGTVVEVLSGQDKQVSAPLVMGGRITMVGSELIDGQPMISRQIRSLQNLLNLALTMMLRNVELGGFLERVIFDAQLPGHYEEVVQPNGQKTRRFVPDATFKVGAGTVNTLVAAHYVDKNGEPKQIGGSPSITYHDPVDVGTFRDTMDAADTAILEECHQLHAQISGDASASGESRKQARADFEAALGDTKAAMESLLRDLLESVLAMAAALAGQPGRFEALRAVVECRINSGPVSADELRLAKDLTGGQPLWSVERAMGATGIDDPDAEAQQMATEAMGRQERAVTTTAPRDPAAAGAVDEQTTNAPSGQEVTNGQ